MTIVMKIIMNVLFAVDYFIDMVNLKLEHFIVHKFVLVKE